MKWHKNLFVQFVLKHSKSKMPFLRIHSVKLLRIFLPIRFYVKSIFDENVPNLAKKSKFRVFIINDFTKILKSRKTLNLCTVRMRLIFSSNSRFFSLVVFHVFTELFVLIVDIKKFSIIPYTDSELWCWNLQTCELKIQRLASSVGLGSSILT